MWSRLHRAGQSSAHFGSNECASLDDRRRLWQVLRSTFVVGNIGGAHCCPNRQRHHVPSPLDLQVGTVRIARGKQRRRLQILRSTLVIRRGYVQRRLVTIRIPASAGVRHGDVLLGEFAVVVGDPAFEGFGSDEVGFRRVGQRSVLIIYNGALNGLRHAIDVHLQAVGIKIIGEHVDDNALAFCRR